VIFSDLGVTGEVYMVIGGDDPDWDTKSRRSGRLNRVNQLTRKGIKYSKTANQHKPKLQIQYGSPKNPSHPS
jgi:hypothetical protein